MEFLQARAFRARKVCGPSTAELGRGPRGVGGGEADGCLFLSCNFQRRAKACEAASRVAADKLAMWIEESERCCAPP